ncbi:putative bifunctional inhibitor/plant lipid transfer protein/seed storage helical [Medicago truncatula]|nr:putative bifunctional inhibitor/plant lipid transfer protein/seed storage helical [Medicago truncatula]
MCIIVLLLLSMSLIFVSNNANATKVYNESTFSTCERIFEYFTNSLPYLVRDLNEIYGFGIPLRRCCQHVDKLNILAQHRTNPRFICWCIQAMMKGTTLALDPSRIQDLPLMCNTTLTFPIYNGMDDCSN